MDSQFTPINHKNKEEIAKKLNQEGGTIIQYGNYCLNNLVRCGGLLNLFDSPRISKSLEHLFLPAGDPNSKACHITCSLDGTHFPPNMSTNISFPSYTFSAHQQNTTRAYFINPEGGNLYVPINKPLTEALEGALDSLVLLINTKQARNIQEAEHRKEELKELTYANVQEMVKTLLQDLGKPCDCL